MIRGLKGGPPLPWTLVTPKRLFRTLSIAEAATWALLIIGMWLKYGPAHWGLGVTVAGSIHGAVFLSCLYVGLVVGINQRFSWAEYALGAAATVIPFATVPLGLMLDRKHRLEGGWRHVGADFAGRDGAAPRRAPLEAWLPLVTWSRYHPLTLCATALLVAALILAAALEGSGTIPGDAWL